MHPRPMSHRAVLAGRASSTPSTIGSIARGRKQTQVSVLPPAQRARASELREVFVNMVEGVRTHLTKRHVFDNAADRARYSPTDPIARAIDDAIDAHRAAGTPDAEAMEKVLDLPRRLEAQIRARYAPSSMTDIRELIAAETRMQGAADSIQMDAMIHPECPTTLRRMADLMAAHARKAVDVAVAARHMLDRRQSSSPRSVA
jgi:hypothetical protein